MDARLPSRAASLQLPGYSPPYAVAAALAAIAWLVAAPAAAQTTIDEGEVVFARGGDNLGLLLMQGGTLAIRDGSLGPVTATGSTLASGVLSAAGAPARLELFGTTTVKDAGVTISASGSENTFPFNVVNKGKFDLIDNAKLTLGGAASFINDSLSRYEIRNDQGIDLLASGSTSAFINRGLVFKRAGAGTSVFRVPVAVEEGGQFAAGQGSIYLGQGGFVDSGSFFGNTASPLSMIFEGNYTFHQFVQTDIGQMALISNSRITLSTSFLGGGVTAGEWTQNAGFRVDGRDSVIEMGAGTVLRNTGSLVTRSGGAVVGRAAVPLPEEPNPVLDVLRARVAAQNPAVPVGTPRGLLLNEGSFDGVIIAGPPPPGPPSASDVIDVVNNQDAGFRFQPIGVSDFLDRIVNSNAVGKFENSGRVDIAPTVDVFGTNKAIVLADEFTQDGSPVLGLRPVLAIEAGGELWTGTFRQSEGDTFVSGLLAGQQRVDVQGGLLRVERDGDLRAGIVDGDGFIQPGGSFSQTAGETGVQGRLRGDRVTVEGGSLLVDGFLGALTSFTQSGGETGVRGQLQSSGDVAVEGGNLLIDEFGFVSGFRVKVGGGSLDITPTGILSAGDYEQTAGDTVVNGVLRGSKVNFAGGTLTGTGLIRSSGLSATINLGTVRTGPGNSPGILTIDGNLDAVGTTFDIEIAGLLPGIEYDQLIVNGQANIEDGILNLRFIDGFVPSEDDVFNWLVASGGFFGRQTLTVNVFSDLAFINGEVDDSGRFRVTSVTPVPVPAAAWALGSGLLVLGGLARRRRAPITVRESLLADA